MGLIQQALNTIGKTKECVSREGQGKDDRDGSLHAKVDGEEAGLDCGKGLSSDSPEHDGAIDKRLFSG